MAWVGALGAALSCAQSAGTGGTTGAGTGGTAHAGGTSGTGGTPATGGSQGTGGTSARGGSGGSGVATGGTTGTGVGGTIAGTGGGAGSARGGSSGGGGSGGGAAGAAGSPAQGGSAGATIAGSFSVLTNRYGITRNGANTQETTLTVANVGGGKFGLLFSRMLDGHVYAQPLYMSGLTINGSKRNVVFVATENNTVAAYDADDPNAASPLWFVSLGTPMRSYPGIENNPVVPPYTVSCRDMYPQTGITSTPVIDPAAGVMYVVSKNFENNSYAQRLHALDILSGKEMLGGPIAITGSVPGTSLDGDGATVTFSAQHHLNRPGLLLLNGSVFIAFASHCDDEPYHGWLFAYDATSLAQKGVFCTTPNGGTDMYGQANSGLGGIWQSGMGLVGDGSDVYFVSGNGAFDSTNKGASLGVSVARMQLTSSGFKLMDWFTPNNAQALDATDFDYTTAAVLLPSPRVILTGGKDGYLNVLDPTNLGKFNASSNQVIQQIHVGTVTDSGHVHGSPVYWNGPSGPTVYLWPESENLRAYRFSGNKLNTTAVSQFTGDVPTHPGGTLSLSANGTASGTGILWATFTSTKIDTTSGHMGDAWHYAVPGALYAFDAANLATPIWTSTANKSRDDLGDLAKFNIPVVANGKVYVASQVAPMSDTSSTAAAKLQVYGLLQ